jgi:hypothetical protein
LVPFTATLNYEVASSLATAQSQGYCLFDFTGFSSGDCITGEVAMPREASYNSTVGFYRVLDVAWSVLAHSIFGTILSPGQAGYAAAAVANRVSSLDGYKIGNRSSSVVSLDVKCETGMLVPYALVNGSQAYFSYVAANPDGINYFALIGNNRLGFEDTLVGGDRDFDDLIIEIRPTACVSI